MASESGFCPRGRGWQNAIQWEPGFPGVASCKVAVWRVGCSHRYCESHKGVTGWDFNCGFWFWQLMKNNLYSSPLFPQFTVLHQYAFQACVMVRQAASMLGRTFSQYWFRSGNRDLNPVWIRAAASLEMTRVLGEFRLHGGGWVQ